MAVNYAIQAEVVDIRQDAPKPKDAFLVDTNVWYWMTYTRASQSAQPYQISNYPEYTNNALAAGAKVYQSGISHAELAHLIEKAEREIYKASAGIITPKEYRHNLTAERTRVCAEIQAACGLVSMLGESLPITIDAPTTNAALNRLQREKVDGYDLFILETMKAHNIVQIITDDGDFATVPDIQVFTANRNVIRAAAAQSKLHAR